MRHKPGEEGKKKQSRFWEQWQGILRSLVRSWTCRQFGLSGMKRLKFRQVDNVDVLKWHAKRFRFYPEGDWEPSKDFKLRDKIIVYLF